jgi:LuxR family maltose regulon positive regulatory protein
LRCQSEPVRCVPNETSIPDRPCGSLCGAVTDQGRGQAQLEVPERRNLFVVSLDDNRHWFRYYHLFAEVLSGRQMAEMPDQSPTLRRRASEWFERHGSEADSIRHALIAEGFERTAFHVGLELPEAR